MAYNDWDADTAKLGRPVVSVFGGREMKRGHDASLTAADFDLGGEFTKDAPRGEKRKVFQINFQRVYLKGSSKSFASFGNEVGAKRLHRPGPGAWRSDPGGAHRRLKGFQKRSRQAPCWQHLTCPGRLKRSWR